LTNIAPEGVPHPIGSETPAPAQPQVVKGLATSHVAGGGFGGVAGAAVAALLTHFHVHVSDMDAAIIGSVAVSAGVGVGHVVGKVGIVGAVKRLVFGSRS